MVSFYAFPVIFIDTATFKKGHPNQKGECPDTLDTPWIRSWERGTRTTPERGAMRQTSHTSRCGIAVAAAAVTVAVALADGVESTS